VGRVVGLLPSRPTLVAFAVSRLVVLAAAIAAETLVTRNPRLTSGADGPLLGSLTSWDGWWYLGIARTGYHAAPLVDNQPDYAFWPLYPAVVRLLSLPWPAFDGLVAVAVSNLAFLVALGLVERLGRLVVGEDRAVRGAILLALSPFGYVFSMAYPEALFLALAVGACLVAEQGRPRAAGLLAGLATLARLHGLVVLPTLAWLGVRRLAPAQRRRLLWLATPPLAALGFLAFVALLAGRPDAYLGAQAEWGRGGLGTASERLAANLDWLRLTQLATFLAGIYLLVFARPDRLPLAYALWPVGTLLLAFGSGNLVSIGRHLTVVVPYFWLLAGRGSRLARIGWPLASTGLLFVLALVAFAGWYVP
jgi:hypothetical protein